MLLGGAFGSAIVAQPSDSIGWTTMSYLKQSEAWLGSENAAGLYTLPNYQFSVAEVYANKQNGKFVDYYQSDNSIELGAKVESFYRFNSKIVFYGQMEYLNFTGKNMGGSYFINPKDNPFDIVEYTDDNRGEKKLENYHLTGAVSADLSKKLSIGGKLDYTAANYSKRKDLRHVNNLMDLYLTAGLVYRMNKHLTLGANYYYRRSTEGLLLDMYGTTDNIYYSLVSYGAFYGSRESFGDTGYTKENEEKPLFNQYHGGSVQLNWSILPQLKFFNELGYKSRSGYYGKKSPSTVVYSEHNSDIWSYHGVLSLAEKKNFHSLQIDFRQEALTNVENIYQYNNSSSTGISNVEYYGTLDTTDKTTRNLSAQYVGHFNTNEGCPTWVVEGGFSYFNRELTASVYPYYRKQNVHNTTFHLSGERNILTNSGMYSIYLGGSYASGGGDIFSDGTYATPSDSQSEPASTTTFLYREFEYMTNKQIRGEVGFKYTRSILKGIKGFTSLHYGLTKAFDVTYLEGSQHHELTWTIGCTF